MRSRPPSAEPHSCDESSLGRPTSVEQIRLAESLRHERRDLVAIEEPLEIRVGTQVLAIVMRTPGADLELTSGLLYAEGIIHQPADVAHISHCPEVSREAQDNVVQVVLREGLDFDLEEFRRNLISSSSCGVCGRDTLESFHQQVPPIRGSFSVSADELVALPERLRSEQIGFQETGGLHAAGLFNERGEILAVREDVGRHNAVDKIVGAALRHALLPLENCLLLVSGRASYEILQKARRAGVPFVAAVSAPTTLAVALAEEGGQTLTGFVREGGFNVYAGAHRVRFDGAPAPSPSRTGRPGAA